MPAILLGASPHDAPEVDRIVEGLSEARRALLLRLCSEEGGMTVSTADLMALIHRGLVGTQPTDLGLLVRQRLMEREKGG